MAPLVERFIIVAGQRPLPGGRTAPDPPRYLAERLISSTTGYRPAPTLLGAGRIHFGGRTAAFNERHERAAGLDRRE